MTKIGGLHSRSSKHRERKDAYDALGEEFDLARTPIEARTAAGLSQRHADTSFASLRVRFLSAAVAAIDGKLLMALDCDDGEPYKNRTGN